MKDLQIICNSKCIEDTFSDASIETRLILENCLKNQQLSLSDIEKLFLTRGKDRQVVLNFADFLRNKVNGNNVTFVINRNINFTNVCYMGCKFCGFAKRSNEPGAEWLSLDEVVRRAKEASERGATEVCIQGGLHPKLPGTYYREILIAIKKVLPKMHIHAFSPFEIWYGAKKSRMSYADFLEDLKESGLGSMPGTAAEILDTKIRKKLTKNKLTANQWIEIIKTAHLLGLSLIHI